MPVLPHPTFPDITGIAGVRLASVATGVKYTGRDDLMLADFAPGTQVAGLLTRNTLPSAPVDWCRQYLPAGAARALIVNAGNANAFTGPQGDADCQQICHTLATALNCPPAQVFAASTGVIGEPLPAEKIIANIPPLVAALSPQSWPAAAAAIMTTDTFPKGARATCTIANSPITLAGIAKGSGMIAPDLATLLVFCFTDAAIPAPLLHTVLAAANQHAFNAISVDSDTSTSDTCLLFASGQATHPPIVHADSDLLVDFRRALGELLFDLAQQVVRDGEGARKLIEVVVRGAETMQAAKSIAKSIVDSPLVKTAIAGADANWGRIIMAIGKTAQRVARDRLQLKLGDVVIVQDGMVVADYDERGAGQYLQNTEIRIAVEVGVGRGTFTAWGCDLTHDYITINAEYRS